MEGQPMRLEHNDGGNEKKSFGLLTVCLWWVVLRWLARVTSFQDTSYKSDAWTKSVLLGVVYLLVSPIWWISQGYMQEGVRIEMVVSQLL